MSESETLYISTQKHILTDILYSLTLSTINNDVTGHKNGIWYIFLSKKANDILYISYNKIWWIYEKAYLMERDDIAEFIQNIVNETFGWKASSTYFVHGKIKC